MTFFQRDRFCVASKCYDSVATPRYLPCIHEYDPNSMVFVRVLFSLGIRLFFRERGAIRTRCRQAREHQQTTSSTSQGRLPVSRLSRARRKPPLPSSRLHAASQARRPNKNAAFRFWSTNPPRFYVPVSYTHLTLPTILLV